MYKVKDEAKVEDYSTQVVELEDCIRQVGKAILKATEK